MSKALNQLKYGTICTIKSSGESGTLEKIFYYPTKYEIRLENGETNHYTTHEVDFDGIKRKKADLKINDFSESGVGESWSTWIPFQAESQIKHYFETSPKIIWELITSLELYNIWFYGIHRTLPVNNLERYAHKFSFDKLPILPGSIFKVRPASLAPFFECEILTVEKNKQFGFTFKTSPLVEEYILFSITEHNNGVYLTMNRQSSGLFSILSALNWTNKKSNILTELSKIVPKILIDESIPTATAVGAPVAKAELTGDDLIAFVVNKALDGDMEPVNALTDKPTRGKAKAMLVKIKRGSLDRPAMPEIPTATAVGAPVAKAEESTIETQDIKMDRLIKDGIDGKMEEINALENKVLRGKIKAAVLKQKRLNKK